MHTFAREAARIFLQTSKCEHKAQVQQILLQVSTRVQRVFAGATEQSRLEMGSSAEKSRPCTVQLLQLEDSRGRSVGGGSRLAAKRTAVLLSSTTSSRKSPAGENEDEQEEDWFIC